MLSMLIVYPNETTLMPPVPPRFERAGVGGGKASRVALFSGPRRVARLAVPGRRATRAGGEPRKAIRHAVTKE
jgi:hypothetical protein